MKVLLLNIFDELEVWSDEKSFILGNKSDIVITNKDEIEKLLNNNNNNSPTS